MDKNWALSVNQLLHELKRIDLGYPMGNNLLFESQPPKIIDRNLSIIGTWALSSLKEFYSHCDGFSLPDVHVGYFIKPIARLVINAESEPLRINGKISGEIHVLGSTGGGDLFVIRKSDGSIFLLPPGPIHNGTYEDLHSSVKSIAPNISLFSDLVLNDISALVKNKLGHTFLA